MVSYLGFLSHGGSPKSPWLFQYKVIFKWLGWFGVPSFNFTPLLNMAIEIVDLPIKMVIFHIFFVCLPEGTPRGHLEPKGRTSQNQLHKLRKSSGIKSSTHWLSVNRSMKAINRADVALLVLLGVNFWWTHTYIYKYTLYIYKHYIYIHYIYIIYILYIRFLIDHVGCFSPFLLMFFPYSVSKKYVLPKKHVYLCLPEDEFRHCRHKGWSVTPWFGGEWVMWMLSDIILRGFYDLPLW